MKRIIFILTVVISLSVILSFPACTENSRARNFGGTEIIEIPDNNIFLNATWKDEHLWYLTKDTVEHYFVLREKSSWGTWEGKVIFKYKIDSTKTTKKNFEDLKNVRTFVVSK